MPDMEIPLTDGHNLQVRKGIFSGRVGGKSYNIGNNKEVKSNNELNLSDNELGGKMCKYILNCMEQ